ncbi:MAG TPA: DUF1013 domain-containing protein [Rhodospirillaceae bacterium]|jgi:hypothetical protein|nr:DUF1013 domain-containing protein [Alphaproteobacteria bacterium]HBH26063.1 DUF1013 domain-containing protein [Rhodospirillaceae bacterium]
MAKNTPKGGPALAMPEATAVWLFDNTTWTYMQIADFTGMALMHVEGIADGHIGVGINGRDPVAFGEMAEGDLERATQDPTFVPRRLARVVVPTRAKGKGGRYTPLSKRGDKPDAIAWIVKNHPEMTDPQIVKLIGTTKNTIRAVRERTHANIASIKPQNPADLGLCTWADLEAAIAKAAANKPTEEEKSQGGEGDGGAGEKGPIAGFDFAHFMPVRQGTQS